MNMCSVDYDSRNLLTHNWAETSRGEGTYPKQYKHKSNANFMLQISALKEQTFPVITPYTYLCLILCLNFIRK